MTRILATLLLVAATSQPALAGVTALAPAPGARPAALGMAGTADVTDPAGVLYNPAVAAGFRGVAVNSAYANWSGDVDHFTNAFSWAGDTGPVTLGGALVHSRLDFKTFEAEYGYLPFNTQSSFMTAAVATQWAGAHGAIALGTSLAWDTSENAGDDILAGFGIRAESPLLRPGGWDVRAALGAASLRNGAGGATPVGSNDFIRGPGPDERRVGVRIDAGRDIAAVAIVADAIDTDGHDLASAVGIDVSAAEIIHARAGYGDGALDGHDVVTLGAGVEYRAGGFAVRLDYARLDTTDDALSANIFGARLAFDF